METKYEFIISKLTDLTGNNELNEHTVLEEIPLNSITFITLVVAIEEQYEFEFDEDMLFFDNFKTVSDLIKYIEKKANE